MKKQKKSKENKLDFVNNVCDNVSEQQEKFQVQKKM